MGVPFSPKQKTCPPDLVGLLHERIEGDGLAFSGHWDISAVIFPMIKGMGGWIDE